jgi:hypothetical protein
LKKIILIKKLKKINEQILSILEASEAIIKELYEIEKPENLYDPDTDGEGMPVIDP